MTLLEWAVSTGAARPKRPFGPRHKETGETFPLPRRVARRSNPAGRWPVGVWPGSKPGRWGTQFGSLRVEASPVRSGGSEGLSGRDKDCDNSDGWSLALEFGSRRTGGHREACGSSSSAREWWGTASIDELLVEEEAVGSEGALESVGVSSSSKVSLHLQGKTAVWFTGLDDNGRARWCLATVDRWL
jgi:hypothetical protein